MSSAIYTWLSIIYIINSSSSWLFMIFMNLYFFVQSCCKIFQRSMHWALLLYYILISGYGCPCKIKIFLCCLKTILFVWSHAKMISAARNIFRTCSKFINANTCVSLPYCSKIVVPKASTTIASKLYPNSMNNFFSKRKEGVLLFGSLDSGARHNYTTCNLSSPLLLQNYTGRPNKL